MHDPETLHDRLAGRLAESVEGLLVAMSGGVDSCTLAKVAHHALGQDMLAVTVRAESTAAQEITHARAFARAHDIPHAIVEHSELSDPLYVRNDGMRCFHCRKGMATTLHEVAGEHSLGTIAMGYLVDDTGDHRPGLQAARDAGIQMPYLELGFTKAQVRAVAEHLGLEVAERPSNACLSSRIAYGLEVTEERLAQIEAAEATVRGLCEVDQVRVRHHGKVARIEVLPEDRGRVLAKSVPVTEALQELGFDFVSLDLLGYRSGSMNQALRASARNA